MNYRIDYAPMRLPRPAGSRGRQTAMTLGFFGLFLLGTGLFWPAGRQALASLLLPGIPVRQLLAALSSGAPAGQALTAFCREVLAGAGIP